MSGSSTLEIARVAVARSEGGTLEAEYALFDASEIELRATDYGAIHEVGYRTTVADALARLDAAGATSAVVRDLVSAVNAVARAYVPPTALPLLGVLSPAELLTGEVFDAERRAYASPVIQLHRLAVDCGINGAPAALQAAGLAAWLREARPDDEVALRTSDYMATRRPGERSIRRVSLSALRSLAAAIGKLKNRSPAAEPPDVTADALGAWLKRRGIPQARIAWAESVLRGGPLARTGPLSDPRALAIDVLLSADRAAEAMPLIDRLEVETGRTPSVHYLRLRASLVAKRDQPAEVAARAASLLPKEPSPELKLLLAKAYSEAGQASRAATVAGEVLAERDVSPALKDLARTMVEVRAELVVESQPPPAPVVRSPSQTPQGLGRMRPSAPALVLDLPRPPSPSVAEITGLDSPLSMKPTPVPQQYQDPNSRQFIMGISSPPQPGSTTSRAPTPVAPAPEMSTSLVPTRPPPPGMDPSQMREAQRSVVSAPPDLAMPPFGGSPSSWIRGASQPPFQSMPPEMSLPRPPGIPTFDPRPPENAETLTLPPGLHGQAVPFDAVPKSVTEARILFTLLSRALGRSYRERFGIVLRTDLSGVEHIQSALRERFVVPAIRSAEEASEVRSHGAFLSEVLARTFGAEWIDIAPSELGYWAMVTPSGLRVWPFGRILRFILQGHRERDLVSYYLELDARARAGR